MRNRINILLFVLVASFGTSILSAGEGRWYVGGGWGSADADLDLVDFDDGSITSGNVDSSDSGWKLFAGVEFGRHFAVETGYADLNNDVDGSATFEGISDGTGSFFVSLPGGPVSVDVQPRGFFGELVGRLRLAKRLTAFGKLGAMRWEADVTVSDLNGQVETEESGTDPVYGAGLSYRFDFGLSLRAEWERFSEIRGRDLDLVSAGVAYRF